MIDRKLTWMITSFLRHGFLSRATLLALQHVMNASSPFHQSTTHPPPKQLVERLVAGNIIISQQNK